MKKFAVILAGCGVYDGAEIHETVLTLLAIDHAGATYQCFAPDILQHHVVNHLTGKEMSEKRNVLVEAARIARGSIKSLAEFDVKNFDALIFPGGFGAAKNLCDWAFKGDQCEVNPEVEHAVMSVFEAGKPIGAMCIAPVILAKLFQGTSLTTGNDPASSGFMERTGNQSVITSHGEVIVDVERKLFTTPCYMLDASISQIEEGTSNIIGEMTKVM
jgi:enhancing lycopene biosynthesis protein 2